MKGSNKTDHEVPNVVFSSLTEWQMLYGVCSVGLCLLVDCMMGFTCWYHAGMPGRQVR